MIRLCRKACEDYLKKRARAQGLPVVEVSREEFVRLYLESGGRPEDAHLQATVAGVLGSEVLLGDRMVRIKG